MRTSIHFRFGLYVLYVTTAFAGVVYFWNHDTNDARSLVFFVILLPSARKLLGPPFGSWHESDREMSNRTLVIGFVICLVAIWGGGLALAHYISQTNHVLKYLMWAVVAIVWALSVYPAYQWWRAQENEAIAC